jgi:hypothetical protein
VGDRASLEAVDRTVPGSRLPGARPRLARPGPRRRGTPPRPVWDCPSAGVRHRRSLRPSHRRAQPSAGSHRHRLGGLVVQILLDGDLGAAGVAINPAPSAAPMLPPLMTGAGFPVLRSSAPHRSAVTLTARQFRHALSNQARAPLLLIGGGKDPRPPDTRPRITRPVEPLPSRRPPAEHGGSEPCRGSVSHPGRAGAWRGCSAYRSIAFMSIAFMADFMKVA